MEVTWPSIEHMPDGAVLVVSTIMAAQGAILPEEEVLLEGTVPARRREIIAGRRMAHRAMFELSMVPVPVLCNSHGAPIWRPGVCGSIAHSPSHIAVVMAHTGAITGLGIDIEDGRDLGAITPDIASDADIAAVLAQRFAFDNVAAVRFVFSAKEALFKCQAPITQNQDLGFFDVRLMQGANGLLVRPTTALPPQNAEVLSRTIIIRKDIQGISVAIALV